MVLPVFARPCKSFTVLRRVRNCQRYYYYYLLTYDIYSQISQQFLADAKASVSAIVLVY